MTKNIFDTLLAHVFIYEFLVRPLNDAYFTKFYIQDCALFCLQKIPSPSIYDTEHMCFL